MTTEIRVLDSEGDLVAAANVFRTAMIGFPRLADLAPGQIAQLARTGPHHRCIRRRPTGRHRRCRDERAHPARRHHRRPRCRDARRGSAVVHPTRRRHRSHAPPAARRRRAWRGRRDPAGFGGHHLRAVRLRRREFIADRRGADRARRTSSGVGAGGPVRLLDPDRRVGCVAADLRRQPAVASGNHRPPRRVVARCAAAH